jgi:hypothetical protein
LQTNSRRSPKTNIVTAGEFTAKLIGSLALQNLLDKLNELELSATDADLIDAALYRGLVLESVEALFTPAEA